MLSADIIAEHLMENGVAAKSYGGEREYWCHVIDISFRKNGKTYAIELFVDRELQVCCHTMFWGMLKSVVERSAKRTRHQNPVDLHHPDSLNRITEAVLGCTTGNCTECAFHKEK
jgi:hypothetical protein